MISNVVLDPIDIIMYKTSWNNIPQNAFCVPQKQENRRVLEQKISTFGWTILLNTFWSNSFHFHSPISYLRLAQPPSPRGPALSPGSCACVSRVSIGSMAECPLWVRLCCGRRARESLQTSRCGTNARSHTNVRSGSPRPRKTSHQGAGRRDVRGGRVKRETEIRSRQKNRCK